MAVLRTKRISSTAQRMVRVRAKLRGSDRPRLSVHRSNRFITVQLIDDKEQKTLAEASSRAEGLTGKAAAEAVGKSIAKKALALGITKVVFDRGQYSYEGNIKALADAAREGGLEF